jgi:cbb3-type cytochrome oxidase subunit 3
MSIAVLINLSRSTLKGIIKVPHASETASQISKLSIFFNTLVLFFGLLVIIYSGYERYDKHKAEQKKASVFILKPQVNDIYFLDMRLIEDKLERKNKYK